MRRREKSPDRPVGGGTAVWSAPDVLGDVDPAVHTVRTYLEHEDLRKALRRAVEEIRIRDASDVGAGYGRMSLVLGEFASQVTAFEREPSLVETGERLVPAAIWRRAETLAHLPADDASFDLVLTFTVLQHLTDEAAAEVLAEVRRVARRPGIVLLCEESDPEHRWGPVGDAGRIFTVGRSTQQYAELMRPFSLIQTFPRRTEPGYPRGNTGHFMLFKTP